MPVRKSSVYSKVDFKTLKKELEGIRGYLEFEKVDDTLEDEIDLKPTKTGGFAPAVITTLEKKIETQLTAIDTSSKILKVIFEKEGLSELVKTSIETLTAKLDEIELYYENRSMSEMKTRFVYHEGAKGRVRLLANTREDRIVSRTRVIEKIFKIKPLITELDNMKEEVILKGGYDVPESMMYD